MTPEYVRRYVCHGLAATPLVLETLLQDVPDTAFDHRPDPDRFTLREAIAHLADWEGIWKERIKRIAHEHEPVLPSFDESQWAIDHDYARADIAEQLGIFRAGREKLVAFLQALPPDAWARIGVREEVGRVTLFELASMVLGHDGYHLRQVVEFGAARNTA